MASEFNPNQNYQYQNFPSFRNIDRAISGPINVHEPHNVLGERYELSVVVPKSKKYRLQKKCNYYPACGVYTIKNERSRIDEINKFKPINGDLIWGINPEYLGKTFYKYFGFTQLQIGLILDYEADVSKMYLGKLFEEQQRVKSIIDPIINNFKYVEDGVYFNDEHIKIFLKFCIDFKIIDDRIDEIITYKNKKWDNLRIYFDDDDESFNKFINELWSIDFKLFSCFSFYHTMKRINFLGVCEVIEPQMNDNELHFFKVRYQYHGEIATFLLSPNMKKHARCNCYWYRTIKNDPLKILIYDSYADIDLLKEKMYIGKNIKKDDIKIKRGCFIGQIKDALEIPFYKKYIYFLMQQFPISKEVKEKIGVKTTEDIYKLIHGKQQRRKLTLNVYY